MRMKISCCSESENPDKAYTDYSEGTLHTFDSTKSSEHIYTKEKGMCRINMAQINCYWRKKFMIMYLAIKMMAISAFELKRCIFKKGCRNK